MGEDLPLNDTESEPPAAVPAAAPGEDPEEEEESAEHIIQGMLARHGAAVRGPSAGAQGRCEGRFVVRPPDTVPLPPYSIFLGSKVLLLFFMK